MGDVDAVPGFGAGFAFGGNCPGAPDLFAGGLIVGGEESADAFFAAGGTGDDQIFDREEGPGGVIIGVEIGHFGVPDHLAGVAV